MGFRFRRRTRLFPGVSINWSKNGLSSISVGGPGATVNIPISRAGGTRSTVGLPGTGLSWSEESRPSTSQRRQQQRPRKTSTEQIISELMSALLETGDALWRQGLVQRVLDYPDTPRKEREAAYSIRSIESCELHCRRARGPAATKRAALEVISAVQTVLAFTEQMGWSRPAD